MGERGELGNRSRLLARSREEAPGPPALQMHNSGGCAAQLPCGTDSSPPKQRSDNLSCFTSWHLVVLRMSLRAAGGKAQVFPSPITMPGNCRQAAALSQTPIPGALSSKLPALRVRNWKQSTQRSLHKADKASCTKAPKRISKWHGVGKSQGGPLNGLAVEPRIVGRLQESSLLRVYQGETVLWDTFSISGLRRSCSGNITFRALWCFVTPDAACPLLPGKLIERWSHL